MFLTENENWLVHFDKLKKKNSEEKIINLEEHHNHNLFQKSNAVDISTSPTDQLKDIKKKYCKNKKKQNL